MYEGEYSHDCNMHTHAIIIREIILESTALSQLYPLRSARQHVILTNLVNGRWKGQRSSNSRISL